ncbi:MAG: porin [Rhodanobacter sp.]
MKTRRVVIAAVLLGFVGQAAAGGPFGDWPTKFESDSGNEYGVKGLYQYDVNDFNSNAIDPTTSNPLFEDARTWRRKELDLYAKLDNGLEIDLGYDWQASWTDNYLKYSNPKAGAFRLGQFKTQVGWDSTENANAGTFIEPSLPGTAAYEGRRLGVDWAPRQDPALAVVRCL